MDIMNLERIPHKIWTGLQNRYGRAVHDYMEERGRIVSQEDYYDRTLITVDTKARSWSLGDIIFQSVNHPDKGPHELGHCIQSDKYGPLYPLLVAIPSAIRNWWFRDNEGQVPERYFDGWPEKQASKIGEAFVKSQQSW